MTRTTEPESVHQTAADIVLASAKAAWENRQTVNSLPLFGPFWDTAAELPDGAAPAAPPPVGAEAVSAETHESTESAEPAEEAPELLAEPHFVPAGGIGERDLSVQVSGWMLMEAAYSVTAGSVQVDGDRGAGGGDDVVD